MDNIAKAYFGKLTQVPDEAPGPAPCASCLGYGFVRRDVPINDPSFGKAFPCPLCKGPEIEQRMLERALRNADIPKPFRTTDFDSYRALPEADTEACDMVEEWTGRVLADREAAGSILLLGPIGTGKTGCGAAAFRQLIRERLRIAACIRTVDLFKELGRAIEASKHIEPGVEPAVSVAEIVDRVSEAGLLMLDDLGAERVSDYREEKLYEILGTRHIMERTTIITSNKPLNDVRMPNGPVITTGLRTQVGERTYSRIIEMCAGNIIEFEAVDIRLSKANRKQFIAQ